MDIDATEPPCTEGKSKDMAVRDVLLSVMRLALPQCVLARVL